MRIRTLLLLSAVLGLPWAPQQASAEDVRVRIDGHVDRYGNFDGQAYVNRRDLERARRDEYNRSSDIKRDRDGLWILQE